ncbi:GATOR complex protein NPRL3-like isoform X3 [Biomphalaria glabrata]|uniref:GATOR complex protein NPRL3 n=1 Tax=Biomphalaria glabrata TaxID=6526 RepID=A0A9W2YJZ6_BIOGL|nr:GATOR complex protein NPRL3-like isoform X3 [Biomphalaria glabrata]
MSVCPSDMVTAMLSDLDPVAVILVSSGTKGNRLLFRYPYFQEPHSNHKSSKVAIKNPYAIKIAENFQDLKKGKSITTFIKDGSLTGFADKTLANFLVAKSELCGKKFSVKIDDVRFVGFPMSLTQLSKETNLQNSLNSRLQNILAINVVFALRANIAESVTNCYQELAQQIAVAIAHEEKRCLYLSKEAKIMMAAFEEASVTGDEDTVSPLKQIIHNSNLAKELMSVFDNLVKSGQVLFFLNQWVEINFCLLHKIHANVPGGVLLETFYRFLTYVRPYHAILLTKPEQELLSSLPLDGCPSLSRLIKLTTPVKNLKILALETDLSITQIYQLVCHLVYWGFAILIYPMCQANQYVLSPSADTAVDSKLSQEFHTSFPELHLVVEMSRFSYPSRMHECFDVEPIANTALMDKVNQVVVWMLRHRILNQLHTYVNLLPSSKKEFSTNPNMCHSTISSTHSSSSSVQVVEESYLSILMEDPTTSNLDRATSMSDVASVNSEESGGQSTTQYTSQLSKSPSHEANSDCSMLPEDSKLQWRMQDNLLNELKPGVKAAILRCPAAKNFEDLSLFAKLVPYFNGKHHLEEIMFYENLTRSQLVTLLEKFKDVLILSSHEALATTLI